MKHGLKIAVVVMAITLFAFLGARGKQTLTRRADASNLATYRRDLAAYHAYEDDRSEYFIRLKPRKVHIKYGAR